MSEMKQRNSNVELLRIVAMCMIIDVHYFGNCNAATLAVPGTGNWIVFQVLESLGICGVNLFVLITGFFSVNQYEIKIRKMVNLLVDIAFWGGVGYLLSMIVGWKGFDAKSLIKTVFPILFGGRWFVKAYLILSCLIPFINLVIHSITKKSFQKLLLILFLLFSVWPSFLPNPPVDDYGYGFVHFIVLYLIAAYIRLYLNVYPPKWTCLLGFVCATAMVIVCSMMGVGYAWAYNFVLVIAGAASLFLWFIQLDIRSKAINVLASCAFGVFLIHTDGFFSELIYHRLFHDLELVHGNAILFLLSCIGSLPFFYLFGFLLESIKKKLFAVSIDQWLYQIAPINAPVIITKKE